MKAAASAAEALGFTVRKLADFSRGRDPEIDVRHHFPDAGNTVENPTMTDEVRRVSIELIGKSGPVEIPVRHIEESGTKVLVGRVKHSVSSIEQSVLSGTHTKAEWREARALEKAG